MTGRPERRRLDRAFKAEPCRINGGWEVRAGESRVYASDGWNAHVIAAAHNGARRDADYAKSLRRSESLAVAS